VLLGKANREANVSALKEGHVSGIEERLHPKDMLVEVFGAGQVADCYGNLADLVEADGGLGSSGFGSGLSIHRGPPFR
jgi:hypothetical protein